MECFVVRPAYQKPGLLLQRLRISTANQPIWGIFANFPVVFVRQCPIVSFTWSISPTRSLLTNVELS